MKRREFLRVSCTAAVAAVGATLNADFWSRSAPSIGYADSWAGPVIDARSLSGDGAFLGRQAVVQVHGFGAQLDAVYKQGRFRAAGPNSVPVRFTMPVDPVEGLRFEVVSRGVTTPLRFAVNGGEDAIPLRGGVYVVRLDGLREPALMVRFSV